MCNTAFTISFILTCIYKKKTKGKSINIKMVDPEK